MTRSSAQGDAPRYGSVGVSSFNPAADDVYGEDVRCRPGLAKLAGPRSVAPSRRKDQTVRAKITMRCQRHRTCHVVKHSTERDGCPSASWGRGHRPSPESDTRRGSTGCFSNVAAPANLGLTRRLACVARGSLLDRNGLQSAFDHNAAGKQTDRQTWQPRRCEPLAETAIVARNQSGVRACRFSPLRKSPLSDECSSVAVMVMRKKERENRHRAPNGGNW